MSTKIFGLRNSLFLWRCFYLVGDNQYLYQQHKINSDKTVTLVADKIWLRNQHRTNANIVKAPRWSLASFASALQSPTYLFMFK